MESQYGKLQYNQDVVEHLAQKLMLFTSKKDHHYSVIEPSKISVGFPQLKNQQTENSLRREVSRLKTLGNRSRPLVVRPTEDPGQYQAICGASILDAAQSGATNSLTCYVANFSDLEAAYLAAMEVIVCSGASAIDHALAFSLLSRAGLTHEKIAGEIQRSRSHVTNSIRLLNLPKSIQILIKGGNLDFAKARPLCGIEAPGVQIQLARKIINDGLTAVQVSKAVADYKSSKLKNTPINLDAVLDVQRLKEIVSEQTGLPCAIVKTDSGNWQLGLITQTQEDLLLLLERLGVDIDLM